MPGCATSAAASIFSKGVLFAERVDATARTVWRNRWQLTRTTPERALRAAPVAQGEVETALEEQQVFLHSQRPLVTWILPALLAVVFVLELAASGGSTPTVITLISLGGINQKLVLAGEWWRMASGTVLHADLNHLLANGISLLIACSTLEALVGRAWAAAIYVVAALAGATASVFSDSTALVSVGASGAVMGVVAAATLCGLVRRRREFGMEAVRLLISVLIPTLGLAVWGGSGAAQIDHHAHFGGAVGGALTAAVLVVGWKKSEPLPPARPLAWAIVAIGCAALAVAAVEVARHHADQDVRLVPESTLPSDLGAAERTTCTARRRLSGRSAHALCARGAALAWRPSRGGGGLVPKGARPRAHPDAVFRAAIRAADPQCAGRCPAPPAQGRRGPGDRQADLRPSARLAADRRTDANRAANRLPLGEEPWISAAP